VKDWQPTSILGAIPLGGRLFRWLDRGVETPHRYGIQCPRRQKKQVFRAQHVMRHVLLEPSSHSVALKGGLG
jgi:hypothetical protein